MIGNHNTGKTGVYVFLNIIFSRGFSARTGLTTSFLSWRSFRFSKFSLRFKKRTIRIWHGTRGLPWNISPSTISIIILLNWSTLMAPAPRYCCWDCFWRSWPSLKPEVIFSPRRRWSLPEPVSSAIYTPNCTIKFSACRSAFSQKNEKATLSPAWVIEIGRASCRERV